MPVENVASATSSDSVTPFGGHGSELGPPPICKCGATAPSAKDSTRCRRGHPLPGHPGPALAIDKYSTQFWQAADAARRDIRAAILSDRGHTEADAPRALLIAADGLAQAVLLRDAAFVRVLESGGPLSSAGRPRRASVVWSASTREVERGLRLIGLERVPAGPQSIADLLASRAGDHG